MSSTVTAVVNFIVPAVRLPLRRFQPFRRLCSTRASLDVAPAAAPIPTPAPDLARARDMLAQVCSTANVSADARDSIVKLCEELIEYGTHTNLTGVKTLSAAIILHGIDSLSLIPTLDALSLSNTNIVDIGSGAGFPGFPVALARPDTRVTLVEATRKKVDFQKHVIDKLHITNVKPVWGRAENLDRENGNVMYDVATARAVAKLHILAEYALPLVKKGGIFIAQKSFNHSELKEAETAIRILGGEIADVKTAWTEEMIDRGKEDEGGKYEREKCLVVIEKRKDTPPLYPRSHAAIKRNPL